MATGEIVVVDGACPIYLNTGNSAAIQKLGYSINGVTIIEDVFLLDVPGDQNGGDSGPPIDIQYLGQVDRVRLELSKWDPAVVDKIQPRLNGAVATPGLISTPGTLIAAGGFGYRLILNPPNRPRNYYFAVPRSPIDLNKGTRWSRKTIEFDCYSTVQSGNVVLYDTNIPTLPT